MPLSVDPAGAAGGPNLPPPMPPPMAPPTSDEERHLVAGLRQRDAEACRRLVQDHTRAMLITARRLLANEEDARDAVQESFVAALTAIDSFAGRSRLSTWLHRVVVNTALMKLRSRRSRRECSIEELLPSFHEDGHHIEPQCPWSEQALQQLDRRETCTLVRDAIEHLPAKYREVILLRDIEGLSTEATSDLLATTPNAVKIRLHRARQALRTLLDRHFKDRHHDLP